MTHDPRILIVALADLLGDISRWASVAGDTVDEAQYSHRFAVEMNTRAQHRAAMLRDHADKDQELCGIKDESVRMLLEGGEIALKLSRLVIEEADSTRDDALNDLALWQDELEKARTWLERARRRLAVAKEELAKAERALQAAKRNLDNAKQLMQKNNNRYTQEAVRLAQDAVNLAQSDVDFWKAEVKAAEEEIAHAERRIGGCQKALHLAQDAVRYAEEGRQYAGLAFTSAEQSQEYAFTCQRHVGAAFEAAEQEMTETLATMTEVHRSISYVDEAFAHFQKADQSESVAQTYAQGGRTEIQYRIQALQSLNQASDLFTPE